MGHKALSKVQMGQESIQGTAVATDFVWRGPFGGLQDARTIESVEEDLGVPLKSSRKYTAQELVEFSMPNTVLTPEQSPHVFEAGIKQVNTGVQDGTSSGYEYAYDFGISAINTISTYTIQSGDEAQAEEANFCFVTSFSISAVKGEAVMISSEWMGQTVADASFTGAITAPTVSEIVVNSGTIYIDDPASGFGITALSAGNVLEVNLEVTTGRVPLFTADAGTLYFVGQYFNKDEFEASLEIKFLYESAAIAERAKFKAADDRFVRVEFTGDNYGTPGSGALGDKMGIRIDFPGSYEEFSAVEHEDGKSIVTATLTGGYENSQAAGLAISIFNELASLP